MAGEDEADRAPSAALTTAEPATAQQRPAGADEQPSQQDETASDAEDSREQPPAAPGFAERGRMRRRARFLRKARELAYRDLGGLVFDLHRFGQRNDPVVLAKLSTLGQIDSELRAIERALHEFRPVTVLREVGIGACPRCAALHGSEDRFCPGCGMAFDASAERPLSTTPMAPAPSPRSAPAPTTPALTGATPAAIGTPVLASATGSTGSAGAAAPRPLNPAGGAAAEPVKPGGGAAQLAAQTHSPAEPLTELVRPHERSSPDTPQVKPTATPVAARPGLPSVEPANEARNEPAREAGAAAANDAGGKRDTRDPEEEPTQIVRPSSDGA